MDEFQARAADINTNFKWITNQVTRNQNDPHLIKQLIGRFRAETRILEELCESCNLTLEEVLKLSKE